MKIIYGSSFHLFQLSLEGNRYSEDPDYEVPQSFRAKRPERAVCDFCRKPADNRDKKKFLLICKDCNAKGQPLSQLIGGN